LSNAAYIYFQRRSRAHPPGQAAAAVGLRQPQPDSQHTPERAARQVIQALARRLPPRSVGAIFSLSRTAGWMAHGMAQRLAGFHPAAGALYRRPNARTALRPPP